MADDLKIIVLEGDETGQELLEQAIRVLDPDVTGVPAELVHYDLSLDNRRSTSNESSGWSTNRPPRPASSIAPNVVGQCISGSDMKSMEPSSATSAVVAAQARTTCPRLQPTSATPVARRSGVGASASASLR